MANNNVKQGVQTPVEETLSKNEAFFLRKSFSAQWLRW